MRHTVGLAMVMPFLIPTMAPPVAAQGSDDKISLAEIFVAEREYASQRSFDEGYRRRAARKLAATLTLQELEGLASDPASGADIVGPKALGSSLADLTFTPVVPCRIIDTRLAGGTMTGNSTRAFFVAGSSGFTLQGGTSTGCGVPTGATAAVMNIVSVSPAGPGNLRAFAYDEPVPAAPNAAVLNYGTVTGLPAIANGTVVPICDPLTQTCTFDMIIQADVSSVDIVIDVAGYFMTFPTGDIMTHVLANDGSGSGLDADLLDGAEASSFQNRVTGACPAGQSIRAIDATGAVTCELDDVGAGDITGVVADTGLTGGALSGTATLAVDDAIVARKDAAAGNQSFDSGTLFIDYSANRVGVLDTSPAQTLDVAGTGVAAADYAYRAAKTFHHPVPGVAFHALFSEPLIRNSTGYWYHTTTTGTVDAVAPVHLPQGAVVNELRCVGFDNDAGNDIILTWTLVRRPFPAGNAVALLQAVLDTSGNTNFAQVAFDDSTTTTIDNASQQYFLRSAMNRDVGAGPNTANLRDYGCRIRYTLTTLATP